MNTSCNIARKKTRFAAANTTRKPLSKACEAPVAREIS
jgi:hypothetical protein